MVKKSVTEKHSPINGEGEPETNPADKYFESELPPLPESRGLEPRRPSSKGGRLPRHNSPIQPDEIELAIEVAEQDGHSSPASFIARHFMGEAYSYLLRVSELPGGINRKSEYQRKNEYQGAYYLAVSQLLHPQISDVYKYSCQTIFSAYNAIEAIESGDAERASIETLKYAAFAFHKCLVLEMAETEAWKMELKQIYKEPEKLLKKLVKEKRKRSKSEKPETEPRVDVQAILRKWAPGYTRMPKNNTQRLVIALLDIRNDAKKYDLNRSQIHRSMLKGVLDIASFNDPSFDRFAIPGKWGDIYDLLVRAGAKKMELLTVKTAKALRKYAKGEGGKNKTDEKAEGEEVICSFTCNQIGQGQLSPWPAIFPELYPKT